MVFIWRIKVALKHNFSLLWCSTIAAQTTAYLPVSVFTHVLCYFPTSCFDFSKKWINPLFLLLLLLFYVIADADMSFVIFYLLRFFPPDTKAIELNGITNLSAKTQLDQYPFTATEHDCFPKFRTVSSSHLSRSFDSCL